MFDGGVDAVWAPEIPAPKIKTPAQRKRSRACERSTIYLLDHSCPIYISDSAGPVMGIDWNYKKLFYRIQLNAAMTCFKKYPTLPPNDNVLAAGGARKSPEDKGAASHLPSLPRSSNQPSSVISMHDSRRCAKTNPGDVAVQNTTAP